MKKFITMFLGATLMITTCLSACTFNSTDTSDTKETDVTESVSSAETNGATLETSGSVSSEKSETDTYESVKDTETETETKTESETETETETEAETEKVHEYVYEDDSGEGYEHILLDRKFDLGFGCEWNLGKVYTRETGLKQGSVVYYQDIGKPFYVLPLGLATKGVANDGLLASSGLEDKVHWQFEEGYKKNYVDAAGKGPYELQDHRLVVNSVIAENNENRLLIEQYNDYLHQTYPELYPDSNPVLVKRIDSNREGRIVFSYNSYNDISNASYAYSSTFAENTWPHLLLHQSFSEPVDLGKYSSIEFSMTVKVNRADQINTWPQGASDRFDQPTPPTGEPVSPSETTLQTYFFIRSKKSPYTLGAFVGIMLSSSNESLNREHLGIEQNGIDFYRINLGNPEGKQFGLEGEWLNVGDKTTVKVDLVKYMEYVLENKFDNKNPASKWYGVGLDDVYMSFFNVGYEYIGNWDCEYELSNMYARGIIDETETPDENAFAGNWHVSVDEFAYSTSEDVGTPSQIIGAAANNSVGPIVTNWSGSYSAITANRVHLKNGWIAVDGYEIENFTCNIYAADGSLLDSVSCGLYGADPDVVNHVANNMGYGQGAVAHRFNGNPNSIDLSAYAGQKVTVAYEVGLVGTEYTVRLIQMDVTVPAS